MAKDERIYPAFRVVDLVEFRERRRNAQSTEGHSSSQVTLPPVSRSSATASSAEQGRDPYATLLRCPGVVPERSASARRSSTERDFQNGFSSMSDYHHTVLFFATPTGEFTPDCGRPDNASMDKPQIRRENLRRFVATRLDGNNSELSRRLGNESTAYVNDLLRDGSTKSFGEKAAASIEDKLGLLSGQLDIKDSPLLMDETRRDRLDDEIKELSAGLTKNEKVELVDMLRGMYSKRKKTRRA
jgi:hypothetical protein